MKARLRQIRFNEYGEYRLG